jgi:hypothetical protein
MNAQHSRRKVRTTIARLENALLRWLPRARPLLDPLVFVPSGLLAIWAVLAAGASPAFGNLPL